MPYPIARRTILKLLAARIEVQGLERLPERGPFIIAANHQSYTDPPQIAFPLIVRRNVKIWFLTTEHVWRGFQRFGGTGVLRWLGMIPILDAKKGDSLRPALEVLERGGIIGIFPEGMRNMERRNPEWQNVLLKGKTGAVRMALAAGCPIVPAGIVAPRGTTAWQAIMSFFRKREPAVVRFGEPIVWPKIDPAALTKEDLVEKTRELMTAIGRLCGKTYRD